MVTYDLLIKFTDSTEKKISGVSDYELLAEKNVFTVTKNGYRSFFPMDNVVYIGREFDLKD